MRPRMVARSGRTAGSDSDVSSRFESDRSVLRRDFGLQPHFFGGGSHQFRALRDSGEHLLVVDLGFGEQNGEFVQFRLAIFVRLLAGFVRLFPLLRFKANFGFALFGSKL